MKIFDFQDTTKSFRFCVQKMLCIFTHQKSSIFACFSFLYGVTVVSSAIAGAAALGSATVKVEPTFFTSTFVPFNWLL